MNKTKSIILGAVVILIGVIFGLREADILNFDIFFDGWWTLFIIIPCAIGVITDRNKVPHIIGVVIGLILLIRNYVDLSEYRGYIVPVCVVLAGILIISGAFKKPAYRSRAELPAGENNFRSEGFTAQAADNSNEYYASFSGRDIRPVGLFTGGKFTATFGGLKLDLRDADIADNCVIETSATFGGVDVIVPSGVRVVVKSNSLFGGTSDKTNKNYNGSEKMLYINTTNLFGGTDIK